MPKSSAKGAWNVSVCWSSFVTRSVIPSRNNGEAACWRGVRSEHPLAKPGGSLQCACISGALLSALLVASPGVALAEPQVIYDSGLTWPLAPFMAIFDEDFAGQSAEPPPKLPSGVTLEALLPIRTPEMRPGTVRPRTLQGPPTATRPLFLIGVDAGSLEWLETHRETLIELGAVGMLIEAESVAEVQQVAARTEGLEVLPASGSELARALGLRHYPVLISARGIEQ